MSNDSITFLVQSIEKSTIIEKNQFVYQKYVNFFDESTLKKITSGIDQLKFEVLPKQKHLPRVKSSNSNTLIRELDLTFRNVQVINALRKKFGSEIELSSVDIWVDNKGYHMPPHVDDASIKLSRQIYLDNGTHPGTSLHLTKDENYADKFDSALNSGYALSNNKLSYHSVEYPVIADGRKSLYLRFG